jgi:hypothetical protein
LFLDTMSGPYFSGLSCWIFGRTSEARNASRLVLSGLESQSSSWHCKTFFSSSVKYTRSLVFELPDLFLLLGLGAMGARKTNIDKDTSCRKSVPQSLFLNMVIKPTFLIRHQIIFHRVSVSLQDSNEITYNEYIALVEASLSSNYPCLLEIPRS